MDAREQRGEVIANTCKIKTFANCYEVPSQSSNGHYTVNARKDFCTCPDHRETGLICKHIHAVRITLTRTEQNADGSTTVSTLTVEAKVKRKTYKQDWPNYNAAQVNENRHFHALLADLCKTIPAPAPKPGKPPINPQVAAFTAILKVHSVKSARRFMGLLDEAHANGHIASIPHFNSVLNFFNDENAENILQGFIQASAAPLAAVESKFAVDSSGFSGARYVRWYDEKYGVPKSEIAWVKMHAVTGVFTNCIASVKVLEANTPDSPQFAPLIADTAKTFTVKEVSADKAYGSLKNCELVESLGGQFYPAFKKDATGSVGGAYKRAFHLFSMNAEEYGKHYHLRSNVESTFSAVKRKFGECLRSKSDRAMRNEALAKCVCQNITCLISAIYELGLSPMIGLNAGCTQTNQDAHILPLVG